MKHYSYFPGCSAESTGLGLGLSTLAIAAPLDIELHEIEDWNCCGSTPYGSLDDESAVIVAARNLALAEKAGFDIVTPCSSCNVTLEKTNARLKKQPVLLARVNKALVEAGLKYNGSLHVRHVVDVLYNDVTPELIAGKVNRKLEGLRVAPYYGCQLVRPDLGLDNTELPRTMDKLVTCTGAEAVDFPLKAKCCGGSLTLSEEDRVIGLMYKLLESAESSGAHCLVTPCPLCQTNLDAYQVRVNAKFKEKFNIPVLYITQLIGLALGIGQEKLGMNSNIISARKALGNIKEKAAA